LVAGGLQPVTGGCWLVSNDWWLLAGDKGLVAAGLQPVQGLAPTSFQILSMFSIPLYKLSLYLFFSDTYILIPLISFVF
jgi:hypothetical protein